MISISSLCFARSDLIKLQRLSSHGNLQYHITDTRISLTVVKQMYFDMKAELYLSRKRQAGPYLA